MKSEPLELELYHGAGNSSGLHNSETTVLYMHAIETQIENKKQGCWGK
jgi:hypothetical protein